MTPGKLEFLGGWLPAQPWYAGTARSPELTKGGGFRLDDPAGEVGLEFMVVTDTSGDRPRSYHAPLAYRGAPLEGAPEHALLGTSEHGVLGRRWLYDGVHDPVLLIRLLALIEGRAQPQHQNVTDLPDPTVVGHVGTAGFTTTSAPSAVTDGAHGTDVAAETRTGPGRPEEPARPATLTVTRLLRPEEAHPNPATAGVRGHVTAGWHLPDGTAARGLFAALRHPAG